MGTTPVKVFLCLLSDLELNTGKQIQLENSQRIAVFRTEMDIYAVEDVCPHAGGTLHNGIVKENQLMCVWHGWCFDLATSCSVDQPTAKLSRFQLCIEGERIYLLR